MSDLPCDCCEGRQGDHAGRHRQLRHLSALSYRGLSTYATFFDSMRAPVERALLRGRAGKTRA
ncbi:hypothetical protein LP419_31070 [Massilia sp. H-1]|nr:hypothetical protein LP419_31070 [Massilia sp. H-1]